jgi:anti-anti-sigma factor
MQLEFVSDDSVTLSLRLIGDVTQNAYGPNSEPLSDAYGPDVYQRAVLVHLGEAGFIDSRGVGWLLVCHKRFREVGGILVLHSMTPEVAQVLKILRMDLVMDLADDETSARAKAIATTDA